MRLRVIVVAILCSVSAIARADDIFTLTTGPGYRYPNVEPGNTFSWNLPSSPTPVATGSRFFYPGSGDSSYFEVNVPFTAPNPIDFGTSELDGRSFVIFTLGLYGEELTFLTSDLFYSGSVNAPTFLPGTYSGSGDILYGGLHDYSYPGMVLTIQSAATPEPSGLVLLGTGLASCCVLVRRRFAAR
jgi:hypothetical protein